MSALLPLQAAVYQRLSTDAGVRAIATGIYDGRAPQDATLPYVVIGSATEVPRSSFGRIGWSDTMTLDLWSGYAGRREVLELLEAIDDALAGPLMLEDHLGVRLRREFADVLVDPTGVRHVPARYRLTTWET